MAAKTKKLKSSGATLATPPWHPNFRNAESLPDTKVVRTSFFVNGAAVLVAISLLLHFAYGEFQRSSMNAEIARWQAEIARDQPASGVGVAKFRKFQEKAKVVKEAAVFQANVPKISQVLLRLAQTLPDDLALVNFSYANNNLALSMAIRGNVVVASARASEYQGELQDDEMLSQYFPEVVLRNSARDGTSGRLRVDYDLKPKPEEKK